ncbi:MULTISPECIES: TolC family protein [Marinobacter]|uniref:Cobalt/zinc/cadmium efflux RND transporter outermembrane protein n=1 Tax=Marinobacter manganoxydans MnI7-9 TaxID=1094979 RepID=G6YNA1_9GAMM|nr:TolC family protein [Marinobacter manganoxydans]EHJ06278.1 cobalt/zinc/cadmium efflux RND transporter outermembrane protein [Marinobacter manganoxydans MnI7-9]
MLFCKPMSTGRRLQPRQTYIHLLCLFALAFNVAVAHAEETSLTLANAVSRTMAQNPSLRVFDLRLQGLEGSRLTANQAPAYEAGLEVENALGSGTLQGVDGAEYTLSLSSVIELGGKRRARTGAVSSRYDLMEAEREAETLDVLGQVTQRYVATLALQEKLDLATQSVELSEAILNTVTRRTKQGAAPEAEVLRAKAALAQSRIAHSALQTEYEKRKMALASLWGETRVDFQRLQGDLFRFESSERFEVLYQQASESPVIRVYASERRMRDAEIRLARSQSESDIRWQIGARRLETTGDTALVAGISMPLFAGRRNRGEVQAARAARDEVQYRQEEALLQLHALLFEAYHTRQQNIDAVEQLRSTVLPDLTKALDLTRQAYERGRYSYVEWTAAQRELLSAREALVEAAATALLNQALIEQLTAQSMTQGQTASALNQTQDY